MFVSSRKGGLQLVHQNYIYRSNLRRQGREKNVIYWECARNRTLKCRGRLKTIGNSLYISNREEEHNHPCDTARIVSAAIAGNITYSDILSLKAVNDRSKSQ
uniref:FLYWCH-type domain-containing protein n=2 Tax=Anopheles darlingi TaxID=43151 RepID=A0A2M4CV39_ANODA